ncbi:hypothetical protein I862_07580 [endosymbiont of Acanthamoeba sp. UWC8]|uniref:hypothetical protein n=1 Tax=endosymbiont of Acanthamoeba sp. UWC8 TaxID=86106 RepID=UPI0004D160F1|nr:hypothetical protein [endosymbiont of Acanthamoeba sp. UWC8]AIF82070.1 hypothetical protein I862_07580 [endosymbiont of Acanthamoeba sp. UWC8]
MRVDKSISNNLIVINSANSPLFKRIEVAACFIKRLNKHGFNNIAVIAGNSGDLQRYVASFPKEVLFIESRNDIELAKNILIDSVAILKEDLYKLAPYIIAVNEAKNSFRIKNSAKVLLVDFDLNNRGILNELSRRAFCGFTIRFGKSNDSLSEKNVIKAAKHIKEKFTIKNDKFIDVSCEPTDYYKLKDYQPVPLTVLPKNVLSDYTATQEKHNASISPIISMPSDSSKPYIQGSTRSVHNNVHFYTGKKEDTELQKNFSRYIEKYSIILGNIARGSIANQKLFDLPNKIEAEIFVGNYIVSLSALVQSLLPGIAEEKSLLSYHLEANPNGYLEEAILRFYKVMDEIILVLDYLSKIYTHSFAEKFIKNLTITLKDFERFSDLPSAEMIAEQLNSENRTLQPEMQQTSSENSIALRKEEKGKEKEDFGTDTEDEIDEKEDVVVISHVGSIKRKWVDKVINKGADTKEKPSKKTKSYVEEETKPSDSAGERESLRRSKQSDDFSRM